MHARDSEDYLHLNISPENATLIFQFDENQDGFLFPEELLGALESVNSNLLSDSHISYIYRVSNWLFIFISFFNIDMAVATVVVCFFLSFFFKSASFPQ